MRRPGRPRGENRDSNHLEVVQLLRRLLGHGALRAEGGRYVLTAEGQALERGQTIDCALVRRCLASDWLFKDGEDLKLSDAGVAFLRRAAAQSDAFRQQHQLPVTAERKIGSVAKIVAVNAGESPLGWLRNRKDRDGRPLLTSEQYEAGERLRAAYDFAHLAARVTSDWSGLAPSTRSRRSAVSADIRDDVIAAKERVIKALEAVGPELAGILGRHLLRAEGVWRKQRRRKAGRSGRGRSCSSSRSPGSRGITVCFAEKDRTPGDGHFGIGVARTTGLRSTGGGPISDARPHRRALYSPRGGCAPPST